MGLLGYLEQRGKGLAEGRLAAAYAFAGSLTILFMVFNPAGQIEVLNLLKGEVIALSKAELRLLVAVFGVVLVSMLLFRREFLLTSFDRDLAFLLKGRQVVWDILLYLLAGLIIAFGVIMAGPLLIFGFLVLPALAAKTVG
jgi:ABC-type Mn2+/Zn2+ transport system permease subunit